MNFLFFYSQGHKKPKKFIATQGEVLGYQVCTLPYMGIEVVIGYLVVGIVETVTDPTRKTFVTATSYYESMICKPFCNWLYNFGVM